MKTALQIAGEVIDSYRNANQHDHSADITITLAEAVVSLTEENEKLRREVSDELRNVAVILDPRTRKNVEILQEQSQEIKRLREEKEGFFRAIGQIKDFSFEQLKRKCTEQSLAIREAEEIIRRHVEPYAIGQLSSFRGWLARHGEKKV